MALKEWVAEEEVTADDLNTNFRKVSNLDLPAGEALVVGNLLKIHNEAGAGVLKKIRAFPTALSRITQLNYKTHAVQVVEVASNKYIGLFWDNATLAFDAWCFTVASDVLTGGTSVNVAAAGGGALHYGLGIEKVEDNKAIIVYTTQDDSPASTVNRAVIASISGTTISLGTVLDIQTTTQNVLESGPFSSSIKKLDTNKFLYVYKTRTNDSSWRTYGVVLTVSGTTITAGSPVNIGGDMAANRPQCYAIAVLSTSRAIVTRIVDDGSAPHDCNVHLLNISGTVITGVDEVQIRNDLEIKSMNAVALNSGLVALAYQDGTALTTLHYDLLSITGDDLAIASQNTITSALGNTIMGLSMAVHGGHFYIWSAYDKKLFKFNVYGNTCVLSNTITVPFADNGEVNYIKNLMVVDTTNDKLLLAVASAPGSAQYGIACVFGLPDMNEFVGIADGSYSAAAVVSLLNKVPGLSGLTAGAVHYISLTGILSLDTTYQKVGRAVSATEMFIEY